MVFKPFANLARQGITKHLVNGNYAQQVIAASQSLPIIKAQVNSHTRPSNGRPTATGSRALSTHATQSNDSNNIFYPTHGQQLDDSLDKDARRYLFSKKILWSKAQHQTKDLQAEVEAADSSEIPAASAVESLAEAVEVEAVSNINLTTQATAVEVEDNTSGAKHIEALSPVDQFNVELEKLKRQGHFKDITIQFQHMLQSGLEPNTETFNCLLSAKAQLMRLGVLENRISYLLDVYRDLLRRNLVPNTKTYSILLTSLVKCARSEDAARELKEREIGRFGFVAPSQNALLGGAVEEGDGVKVALQLFDASTYVVKDRAFGVDVYTTLIEACARRGFTEEMFSILHQMETSGVKPNRDIYFSFIDAFAKDRDLHSVLEMYEEVKTSVTESDKDSLYKHLVMAYVTAGDTAGANSFLEKVVSQRGERSDVIIEGFVEGFLYKREFGNAMTWANQFTTNGSFHCFWTMSTLAKAADAGDFEVANQAYQSLQAIMESMESQEVELNWTPKAEDLMDAKTAFLALCARTHRLDLARQVWAELLSSKRTSHLDLGTTVAYVKLLFDNGCSTEALRTVANMISGFESAPATAKPGSWAVAAGWRNIIDFLAARQLLTPEVANEIWKVGGYTPEGPLPADCIKSLIAACSTVPLLEMTWAQLDVLLQLNACSLLAEGRNATMEDLQRFEQTVNVAMRTLPLDSFTKDTVSHAISLNAPNMHPEFVQSWREYLTVQAQPQLPITYAQDGTIASPTLVASEGSVEEQDPHWQRMDIRASNTIDNMIDKKKGLNEIMKLFRSTKDNGKVLKYQTIARLISHATRMKNMEACNDVFATAKKEIPLLSEFSSVRSGWCYIYDSMIAACLNFGEHQRAAMYRDEMAQIGGVPSANTYGLFIVNLKQSHETFDEASEATKLFEQSKAQNVFPTPFLYNAVIGKLARARRVDDCLYYYSEMRALGLKPTSVTYGTMINALCRVSDERYAEELFQEMESMPNYKPRAAPYNSMIQFFAITKRDRAKVLQYYQRMLTVGIEPTGHTYKLLIDAYASLDPPDIDSAQGVLDMMEKKRVPIECTHHASLIHAKGCVLHDIEGCLAYFHKIMSNRSVKADAILYQALFEALVANHRVHDTSKYLEDMKRTRVEMTPYIANTLIHGWALEKNIENAKSVYDMLNSNENSKLRREPSTYEAMTRAYLAVEDRNGAMAVVNEMLSRGYPSAVMGRILDLVKGGQMFQTVVG